MRYKEILNETTAGASASGSVAGVVSGLGAGDPKSSIYYKKKPIVIKRLQVNSEKAK